jgi:uncharacterized protein (TIGR02588 family)
MTVERMEGGSAAAQGRDRKEAGRRPRVSPIEKLTAGIGLAMIGVAAGTMGYEALLGSSTPPDIGVEVVAVRPITDGFLAEIRSVNRGGTTGAQVRIEGVLLDGDRPVEVSSVTFSYVPNHSHQSGGLYFRNDPARHRLEVRVTGYEEP